MFCARYIASYCLLVVVLIGKKTWANSQRNYLWKNQTGQSNIPFTEDETALIDLYGPFHIVEKNEKEKDKEKHISLCKPRHIHLSLGVHPWNSMTVSFSVPLQCPFDDIEVMVIYGVDSEHVDTVVAKRSDTYSFQSVKKKDLYESDYLYHVSLAVQPSTSYTYQISVRRNIFPFDVMDAQNHRKLSNEQRTDSPLLYFKTTHDPREILGKGTKIAIVGDIGQTYNSTVTMRNIFWEYNQKGGPTILLCPGDMTYANSYQKRWDSWFSMMEPVLAHMPIQVSAGNHEAECDTRTFSVFEPYEARFRMPNTKDTILRNNWTECVGYGARAVPDEVRLEYSFGNSFYAFTYGTASIITLNSYTFTHPGSTQYTWLENELIKANANRLVTPWILIQVHVPLYNTYRSHNSDKTTIEMRSNMERLFHKYRVNFVFNGHVHAYARTKNVVYNKLDPTGPIYFTVGTGGNREQLDKKFINDIPEKWVAKRDNTDYGFGTLEFLNATHAEWIWIRNKYEMESNFEDQIILQNQFFKV